MLAKKNASSRAICACSRSIFANLCTSIMYQDHASGTCICLSYCLNASKCNQSHQHTSRNAPSPSIMHHFHRHLKLLLRLYSVICLVGEIGRVSIILKLLTSLKGYFTFDFGKIRGKTSHSNMLRTLQATLPIFQMGPSLISLFTM